MTTPHLRSAKTPGLILQPRDLDILRLVINHRFLRSDHLHALMDHRIPRRVVQVRLQKLARYDYLRRLYVPVVLDGVHAPLTHSRQPIYTLDSRGVQMLRDLALPGTLAATLGRPERPSYHFLSHHLVVTDFLVALKVASRTTPTLEVVTTEAESSLWGKLRRYRRDVHTPRAIVPDGAFTLHYPETGEIATFYLEVVRADVKGGNAALLGKIRRYVELNRQGFFRTVYGHERIRAVLLATTSLARAAHIAALARKLTQGRRLFWAGPYQEKSDASRLRSLFTTDHILTLRWETPERETLTLLQPHLPSNHEGRAT